MFSQLTTQELTNRKNKLDEEIESLRKEILIRLDSLETLCKKGAEIQEELTQRNNVSNTKQT